MKNSIRAFVSMAAICLSLLAAYATETTTDVTPVRKTSIVKKALILGMMMQPVSGTNILGECYMGTINPATTTNISHIVIDTIKAIPCGFYYDYPATAFAKIDMAISTSCGADCSSITIESAELCGKSFKNFYSCKVYGDYTGNPNPPNYVPDPTHFTAMLNYNYRNNNAYNEFSLSMDKFMLPNFQNVTNCREERTKPCDSNAFVTTFKSFMATGKCDSNS